MRSSKLGAIRLLAALPFIATVSAHMAPYADSVYGMYTDVASFSPIGPDWDFDDWWFRGAPTRNSPPVDGAVSILPAGGTLMLEITCNIAWSSMGVSPTNNVACPGNIGAYHSGDPSAETIDTSLLAGCALAIADVEAIEDVTVDNLAIFSVQANCVNQRDTTFNIPARMPPCTGEYCMCAWMWEPQNGTGNYYQTPFRCDVTGSPVDATPIMTPLVNPVYCPNGGCVGGAKRPIYYYNSDYWNIDWVSNNLRPGYHASWGWTDGAQDDIFMTAAQAATYVRPTPAPLPVASNYTYPLSSNLAKNATATASSSAAGSSPGAAIDGVISGYRNPGPSGDEAAEWSSNNQLQGAWLLLTWPSPITTDLVVMYDRPNWNDYCKAGTLTFSDGTNVTFGLLDNGGAATSVNFTARTTTTLLWTCTQVSAWTSNVGLAEIQVYMNGVGSISSSASASASRTSVAIQATSSFAFSSPASSPTSKTSSILTNPTPLSTSKSSTSTLNSSFSPLTTTSSVTSRTSLVLTSSTSSPSPSPSASIYLLSNDLALNASAISTSKSPGQAASAAIDGVTGGYTTTGGDYTKEWASAGQGVGAGIKIVWPVAVQINTVILFDRPNLLDQITAGILYFSDGTTAPVRSLNNDGSATVVVLGRTVNTTSVLLSITAVSATTQNVGLSEMEVYGEFPYSHYVAAPTTTAAAISLPTGLSSVALPFTLSNDLALNASAISTSKSPNQGASAAIDGIIGGYTTSGGDYTKEWASNGQGVGAAIRLTWPVAVQVNTVVLYDRPNLNDNLLAGLMYFSDGTTFPVPALINNGSATTVQLGRTVTTTYILLSVTAVSSTTSDIGLSEFEVFGPYPYSHYVASSTSSTSSLPASSGSSSTTSTSSKLATSTSVSSTPRSSSSSSQVASSASPTTLSSKPATTTGFSSPSTIGSESVIASLPFTWANDLALNASAIATSKSTDQPPSAAIDGVLGGYTTSGGDYTKEWASDHQGIGAALRVTWPTAVQISTVILYDRPNLNDQIWAGLLYFSDGTTTKVPTLNNDGSATTIALNRTVTTTYVLLSITDVSATTSNIGLSEIQVFGPYPYSYYVAASSTLAATPSSSSAIIKSSASPTTSKITTSSSTTSQTPESKSSNASTSSSTVAPISKRSVEANFSLLETPKIHSRDWRSRAKAALPRDKREALSARQAEQRRRAMMADVAHARPGDF